VGEYELERKDEEIMELILDVWEGALDINEPLLLDNGIAGLIIRINDMNGGHHKDTNFDNQWAQAVNFLRAPYFVYNPWVTGSANYQWLKSNLPSSGVTRLFVDIEVIKSGYPAATYADEVQAFMQLALADYPRTAIYTGGWFLPIVAHWPGGDYWWARYPYTFYPDGRENWSWTSLWQAVNDYGFWPDQLHKCPGTVKLWQFTGDRLILPGCANRPIDISMWNGGLASLQDWWGSEKPEPVDKLAILWREAEAHGWNLEP